MKKRSLCLTFSQKRHNTLHGSGGGGGGLVVVGTSSAPSSCGMTSQAGEGGVSEGGGAALSTVGRGAASGVRGSGGIDNNGGVGAPRPCPCGREPSASWLLWLVSGTEPGCLCGLLLLLMLLSLPGWQLMLRPGRRSRWLQWL